MKPGSFPKLILLSASVAFAMLEGCAASNTSTPANAATAANSSGAATEAEPQLSVLPFAWPAGASAVVIEDVVKKGRSAKLRYRLDVSARQGGGLQVQIADLKFIAMQGADLNDPTTAAAIAALEQQVAAGMPAFLVTADGQFDGITDYEGLVDLALQNVPEASREAKRKAMLEPGMQALLLEAISKIWRSWAGAWVGQELAEGYVVKVDYAVEADGTTHTFPASYEHRGAAPDAPNHVALSFSSTLDGEAAKAVMGSTMAGVIEALAASDAADAQKMQEAMREMSISKVSAIDATVDAATLLPLRSHFEETTVLVIQGQRRELLERHSYQFAWTLPKGRAEL